MSSSSSACASTAPAELTLVYRPAIGGASLELAGRALSPASPAEVTLTRVRGDARDDDESGRTAPAYASADRVSAAEGARFQVFDGKELAAEGVFARRQSSGSGWRVECRRPVGSPVAEVVVLAEGGVLVRARARASLTRAIGCLTRLEGIPEEEASWGPCECGACGEDWEVVGDDDGSSTDDWKEQTEEAETMRWALEMARGRCASASGCSPRPAGSAGGGRSDEDDLLAAAFHQDENCSVLLSTSQSVLY